MAGDKNLLESRQLSAGGATRVALNTTHLRHRLDGSHFEILAPAADKTGGEVLPASQMPDCLLLIVNLPERVHDSILTGCGM